MNKLDFLKDYGIPECKILELSDENYWENSIWDYNDIFDNFDESLARENFDKLLDAGLPFEKLSELLEECDALLFTDGDVSLEYFSELGFSEDNIQDVLEGCDAYILAEYITRPDEVKEDIEQLLDEQSEEEVLELLIGGGII